MKQKYTSNANFRVENEKFQHHHAPLRFIKTFAQFLK